MALCLQFPLKKHTERVNITAREGSDGTFLCTGSYELYKYLIPDKAISDFHMGLRFLSYSVYLTHVNLPRRCAENSIAKGKSCPFLVM